MFPVLFQARIATRLPVPTEYGARRVAQVLQSVVSRKVLPRFGRESGVDPQQVSRIRQSLVIQRLEDPDERVRFPSLSVRAADGWVLFVLERFFDFLAFNIPLTPEYTFGAGTVQERRLSVLCEFLLRHEIEHMLRPGRREREVLASDVEFAMEWLRDDSTAYHMLKSALEDAATGLNGSRMVELLESAELGVPGVHVEEEILREVPAALAELPGWLLSGVFPQLDTGLKSGVLSEGVTRSRDERTPLLTRAAHLDRCFRVFFECLGRDVEEAFDLFHGLHRRVGAEALLRELRVGVEPGRLSEMSAAELFNRFKTGIEAYVERSLRAFPQRPAEAAASGPQVKASSTAGGAAERNLQDRIEEARANPAVPRAVLEIIDRNRASAVGQSGAKYSELIETLLAIPWGRFRRVWVSPEQFEAGLDRTHHGLKKPKERLCDFFANLIWRTRSVQGGERGTLRRSGSALLLVGPPGVGKTSLAISMAENLGIPYHKISLGGMKDEADIRGYGFTYEGSKPGPIIQGLVKMGVLNGMFIMDEADKTERFAIATLLEILDPEQNHLYHDKYTQTTVDIDLSNAHFVLTANTLETVPPAVLNRCEVIVLDRYGVEEKIAIAREHLIPRVRERTMIGEEEVLLESGREDELIRYLITRYTHEAGVRDLERVIRTLFLRVHRLEVLGKGRAPVRITRSLIRQCVEEPDRPRLINAEDRVGEMLAIGVNAELGVGSIIPVQVTAVPVPSGGGGEGDARGGPPGRWGPLSMVHATGNIERVMDESRKVASTAILHRAEELGIDRSRVDDPVHLHFMGGSTRKDGPSAGGAIALALVSHLVGRKVRRDVAMTGEIDTRGRVTGIGELGMKIETAAAAGCRTLIIPRENLTGSGGVERLPEALREELQILDHAEWRLGRNAFDPRRHVLQVVAVEDVVQAAEVAFIDEADLDALESGAVRHAKAAASALAAEAGLRGDAGSGDPASETPAGRGLIDCCEDCSLWVDWPEEGPGSRPGEARDVVCPPFDSRGAEEASQETDDSENPTDPALRQLMRSLFYWLERLPEPLLRACPFLSPGEGRFIPGVAFIPERYRLDSRRAGAILARCLRAWLKVVEDAVGSAPEHENRPAADAEAPPPRAFTHG